MVIDGEIERVGNPKAKDDRENVLFSSGEINGINRLYELKKDNSFLHCIILSRGLVSFPFISL